MKIHHYGNDYAFQQKQKSARPSVIKTTNHVEHCPEATGEEAIPEGDESSEQTEAITDTDTEPSETPEAPQEEKKKRGRKKRTDSQIC